MRRWVFILLYVAAATAFVIITNARAQSLPIALLLLMAASASLGWNANWWPTFLLAALLVPMSLPFGYANDYAGGDAPPVLLFAQTWAPVSAVVILAATWWRRVTDREREESADSSRASPVS